MHKYDLMVVEFMQRISSAPFEVEEKLLKPAAKDTAYYLRKLYEEDPNKPFTIRMSNIGRPLCMLQMEMSGAKKLDVDWHLPLRLTYGGVVEGLSVNIIRLAGIPVQGEQIPVSLPVEYELGTFKVNGTLDIIIDGKVWDLKSASPHSYANKFESYKTLKEHDDFGYLPQLYGYSKACGVQPGGWIVVDKSSGAIKFIEVGDSWEKDQEESIKLINHNVNILLDDADFKRCFDDVAEAYKKVPTGNRCLKTTCSYCNYKYACWPGLQYLPSAVSKAFDRAHKYYTVYNDNSTIQKS